MAPLPKALILLCLACLCAHADGFQIDQPIISVADGVSEGGDFSVTGNFHAPSTETLSDPNFQLIGTFSALTFNHAPAANLDTFTRPADGDLKIEWRQLLANDFDPDADDFTIQISSASAGGVPIQLSGPWIYYLHTSTNADYFTYTIADPHGAISHGRVDISVGAPNSQFSTQLRIEIDEAGAHIQFNGIQNRAYLIQSRDTLETPWIDRAAATHLGLGRFQFNDATGGLSRFYRIVYRP